jgi:hypothetical protein
MAPGPLLAVLKCGLQGGGPKSERAAPVRVTACPMCVMTSALVPLPLFGIMQIYLSGPFDACVRACVSKSEHLRL